MLSYEELVFWKHRINRVQVFDNVKVQIKIMLNNFVARSTWSEIFQGDYSGRPTSLSVHPSVSRSSTNCSIGYCHFRGRTFQQDDVLFEFSDLSVL